MASKTKAVEEEEAEAPPQIEQFASPHDVYGPPTNVAPAGGSNMIVGPNNAAGVNVAPTGGSPKADDVNDPTGVNVLVPGGSPSDEAKTPYIPTLTSISPTTGTTGTSPITVTATGTQYFPSSRMTANGTPVPTTYVSATSVTGSVSTATLGVGAHKINVANGALVAAEKTLTVS